MGIIRDEATGEEVVLEAHHLVGRSDQCSLKIEQSYVSAEHASLSWDGEKWLLRDLASTNGTFLDAQRVQPSSSVVMRAGQRVAFGDARSAFVMVADGGPQTLAQPLAGGGSIVAENGLLALPSGERPVTTVYRNTNGEWVVDSGRAIERTTHRALIDVDGQVFRLFLPQARVETSRLPVTADRSVAGLCLDFLVSREEEHIELRARFGLERHDCGARAHNYLLLFLARRRLADAAMGEPPPACGWIFQEEICDSLRIDPERLNVDVYRVRRQIAALELTDPAEIIQRRPRTKQLRIGTACCSIEMI